MSFELVGCSQRLITFEKGEEIYYQHGHPEAFYFVKSGLVGLSRLLLNGKEFLGRVYSDNEYFGCRSLFSDQTYHLSCSAITFTEIYAIHVDDKNNFFTENPTFIRYLYSNLATELRECENRLSKMPNHCVELRVMDSIIALVKVNPDYNWTYREIASHCGCTTETVIRVSKKLRSNDLMHSKRNVKWFDLDKLYTERMQLANN